MQRGYISLWRKIREASFYKKSEWLHLAIHLLLSANHKDGHFPFNDQVVFLKRGQVIVGREALSKETGLGIQEVRTALKHLKKSGFLTIEPTKRFSIVTICKYSIYQDKDAYANHQANQLKMQNQPSDNQQPTTNNNVINVNNEKDAIDLYEEFSKQIKVGGRKVAVFNIGLLLSNGITKDRLKNVIGLYASKVRRENIQEKFRTQANNFFDTNGQWLDFKEVACKEKKSPDQSCVHCRGTGQIYSPGSGKNFDCICTVLETSRV